VPSLLEKVHLNSKAGHEEFVLFELGKTHDVAKMDSQEPTVPAEAERLGIVYACKDELWETSERGTVYYQLKQYVEHLCAQLGVEYEVVPLAADDSSLDDQLIAPFELTRSGIVIIDGAPVGIIGELTSQVRNNLKLPLAAAAAELDILALMGTSATSNYTPLSKFPYNQQDITLKLSRQHTTASLLAVIDEVLARQSSDLSIERTVIDLYVPPENSTEWNVTVRFRATSNTHTLTHAALADVLNAVSEAAHEAVGAVRL
jgi:phenylalanyl-tRNA synthetase beta chain